MTGDPHHRGWSLRSIHTAWAGTRSGTRLAIAATGYALACSLAWAAITPIGGVPDEPAHIAYAAGVVRGDFGQPTAIQNPEFALLPHVQVPEWIGSIDTCYKFAPKVTADCAVPIGISNSLRATATTVVRYPPLYYWIVGWPTLILSGSDAVYAMRALSAGLVAGLIGLGLALASPNRRSWLALAAVIALTPTATHLVGSVNPNALEIGAVVGLGTALIGISGPRGGVRSAISVTALAAALAWSRPFRFLLVLGVVAIALVVNWEGLRSWVGDRTVRLVVWAGTAMAVASAAVFEMVYRSPVRDLYNDARLGDAAYDSDGFLKVLRDVERLSDAWLFDLVGRFGWLDHAPPEIVRVGWLVTAATLVILAVAVGSRRQRLAIALGMAGAFLALPILTILATIGGARWYQARYHLSVVALTFIVAMVAISASDSSDTRRAGLTIARWGALLAAAGTLVSIASSMHRYAIGGLAPLSRLGTFDFWTHATWLSPRTLAVAGLAAAALVAIAVVIFFESKETSADRPEAHPD